MGSTAGGTSVVLRGQAFQPGAQVFFGARAASSTTFNGGTSLGAVSPAGAEGVVSVRVFNPNGLVGELPSAFTYVAPPVLGGLSRASGGTPGGDVVTVTGQHLDKLTSLTFGGQSALILTRSADGTSVGVQTPPHPAGTVDVAASNAAGTATLPGSFTYVDAAVATAAANATATAAAQRTAAAGATQTAIAGATFAAATATAQAPGSSAGTALQLTVGARAAGSSRAARDISWYRFGATAGHTYVVTSVGADGANVDTQLSLWRSVGGTLQMLAFDDDNPNDPASLGSFIAYVANASDTVFVAVTSPAGTSFEVLVSDVTTTPVPTAVPPTTTPTFTATPSPTPTPTDIPTVAPSADAYEPDDASAQASTLAVGAVQSPPHLFVNPTDVDYAKFVATAVGRYTVRTLNLTGGADPAITIVDADGVTLVDPDGGQLLDDDDDYDLTGEPGAAAVSFDVNAGDVGRTYYVRVRNANQGLYGVVGSTPVGYQLVVERADYTPTPTGAPAPIPTSTPTPSPSATRTPAPGDAHELDDSRAAADARGAYDLKHAVDHRGSQALSASRGTGPQHTFNVWGDEDWLAVKLPTLFEGSQLVVRATNTGLRAGSNQRTDARAYLYRPADLSQSANVRRLGASATDGLVRVARGELCADDPNSRCIVVTFDAGGALLYSNKTWYVRLLNFEPELFGSDVTYDLRVEVLQPSAVRTPTPTATATPVVTGTPLPSPTPTPRAVSADVDCGRSSSLSNGSSQLSTTRGFCAGSGVHLEMNEQAGPGGAVAVQQRARGGQAAAGAVNVLKTFLMSASDPDTDARITRFNSSVSLCTTFTLDDLAAFGVDQQTLQVYYVDPATGDRLQTGITRTKLVRAGPAAAGQLCFKTTHFTQFLVAGGALAAATPLPTPTPAGQSAYSVRLFFLPQRGTRGW
jgi:hypothetical protein